MEKLLFIITIADLKLFTTKSKPIIYTEAFVELDNQKNHEQMHEIDRIVEFER